MGRPWRISGMLLAMVAGLPLLIMIFFWVRSHWWVDSFARTGGGGTLKVATEGGLNLAWNRDAPTYFWFRPSELYYIFEAPEWQLSLGDDPAEEKRGWFGAGPYAGADIHWATGAGSADWSLTVPWWSLTILAGVWTWLMWFCRGWVKRRRNRMWATTNLEMAKR